MDWYPTAEGLLPKWLYFVSFICPCSRLDSTSLTNLSTQVSIVSLLNSVQAYSTLTYTRQIYKAQPDEVTGLSGRTFGTWTALSSVIRLYASLNIHDPRLYELALATYGIAWLHFMSEWQFFKTAGWGKGLGGPVFVSTGSLIWMISVWGSYVQ